MHFSKLVLKLEVVHRCAVMDRSLVLIVHNTVTFYAHKS